jgi:hypothetical protein
VISGKRRRGSRRCGAAAFAAPFGRKPYGATSCRARGPGTGRSRSPPSRPDAVPPEQGQAVTLAPSAPIAVRKVTATGTERRKLSRSAPPASRAPEDPF